MAIGYVYFKSNSKATNEILSSVMAGNNERGAGCGVNDSKKSLTGRKSVIGRNNRFLLYLLTFFSMAH